MANEDTCYILHCAVSREFIAAAGSNNVIKLYDINTHVIVNAIPAHTDTIHETHFINDSVLVSCSSDRTVKIIDCKKASIIKSIGQKGEAFSLDIVGDVMAVAVGSSDVTRVRFHPKDPTKLFSASVDGLICLYDLNIEDEDDAIVYVMNGEHSISTMGFFGNNCSNLYSLSTTERLSIWDLESGSRTKEYGDLRTILQEKCGLEVNYFVSCQYSAEDSTLIMFGGDFSGTGIIFQVTADQVIPISRLIGGHADVIRTAIWNKEERMEDYVSGQIKLVN
eukprot:gene11239-13116_t